MKPMDALPKRKRNVRRNMIPIPLQSANQRIGIIDAAPSSSGKTNLLKHLQGDILTRNQAIIAKCCDCMGYFNDGRFSCEILTCPLFPFMPYRKTKGDE